MARVPQKQGRCKSCGFRLRGPGHEKGAHHTGGRIGPKILAKGRHFVAKLTKPASAGQGFDFSAVKSGGVRK
jgi:hypothetical protein